MSADPESRPQSGAVSVVLADDHELVRDGIRMVLEAEADIEVVAQAADADAAARYVLGQKPDILVLDLSMPGRPSLELLPQMIDSSPSLREFKSRNDSDGAYSASRRRTRVCWS